MSRLQHAYIPYQLSIKPAIAQSTLLGGQELEQLRSESAKTLAAVEGRRSALARGSEQIAAARVAVDTASRECATGSAALRCWA